MFDKKIITSIKNFILPRGETIAVAESVTAGLIQAAVASAENASQFFQGGITAYNLGQKYRHLFIEPIHAASCNCVSERVAKEMALHVCNLFSSDWGIGITGYAVPSPESNNSLFAYYAIALNGNIALANKIIPEKKEPFAVQLLYVNEVLKDFATLIKKW